MTGKTTSYGKQALGLIAIALLLAGVPAARAVTRQSSFQVSAFVLASCGVSARAIALTATPVPSFVACQPTPELSPILAAPPRAILQKDDASGEAVLTMEF